MPGRCAGNHILLPKWRSVNQSARCPPWATGRRPRGLWPAGSESAIAVRGQVSLARVGQQSNAPGGLWPAASKDGRPHWGKARAEVEVHFISTSALLYSLSSPWTGTRYAVTAKLSTTMRPLGGCLSRQAKVLPAGPSGRCWHARVPGRPAAPHPLARHPPTARHRHRQPEWR